MGSWSLKCEICGLDVDLPFKCNYCKHYYCPEHRLPESHDCSETWRVKAVRSARSMAPPYVQEAKSVLLPQRSRRVFRFGSAEKKHLVLGTALVTAAGISFFISATFSVPGLILATFLFSTGFILHELAHKYVAQGYGLWAEFRLNLTGVLLTALSVFSPLKFIAPGAVMISGAADRDSMGRTALAGPVVNVVITTVLLALIPALGAELWLFDAILAGASINSFLAVFNLIPVSIFDGRKVYVWNRKLWGILFAIALAMTIYTTFVLHPL
jgi:Zn-dependent protease